MLMSSQSTPHPLKVPFEQWLMSPEALDFVEYVGGVGWLIEKYCGKVSIAAELLADRMKKQVLSCMERQSLRHTLLTLLQCHLPSLASASFCKSFRMPFGWLQSHQVSSSQSLGRCAEGIDWANQNDAEPEKKNCTNSINRGSFIVNNALS